MLPAVGTQFPSMVCVTESEGKADVPLAVFHSLVLQTLSPTDRQYPQCSPAHAVLQAKTRGSQPLESRCGLAWCVCVCMRACLCLGYVPIKEMRDTHLSLGERGIECVCTQCV